MRDMAKHKNYHGPRLGKRKDRVPVSAYFPGQTNCRKRNPWPQEHVRQLVQLYHTHGNQWSVIGELIPQTGAERCRLKWRDLIKVCGTTEAVFLKYLGNAREQEQVLSDVDTESE